MKQTAVEWYEKEINYLLEKYETKEISKRDFITMKHNLFYPAKEMEKQQQGYSESDMTNYALYILHNNVITPKEWLEQFKKK